CWKSAIGIAASAHLAIVAPTCTHIEFLPAALADSDLRKTLVTNELEVVDGVIPLPTRPGLGIDLNEEALNRFHASSLRSIPSPGLVGSGMTPSTTSSSF